MFFVFLLRGLTLRFTCHSDGQVQAVVRPGLMPGLGVLGLGVSAIPWRSVRREASETVSPRLGHGSPPGPAAVGRGCGGLCLGRRGARPPSGARVAGGGVGRRRGARRQAAPRGAPAVPAQTRGRDHPWAARAATGSRRHGSGSPVRGVASQAWWPAGAVVARARPTLPRGGAAHRVMAPDAKPDDANKAACWGGGTTQLAQRAGPPSPCLCLMFCAF
jgi:hypothetical protein